MEAIMEIPVRRTVQSRLQEVDWTSLEFGKYVADHMLVADFFNEQWHNPQITPFANLSLSPATLALHYGQSVFEGMKAFRAADGRINIFRIEKHYERLVRSLHRMCMPAPSYEMFEQGLVTLIDTDRNWVPSAKGASLYIRPFIFASESKFGVKVSEEYRFIIFTGPVPALFTAPIKVKVETDFIRAAKGGTGFAKCAGNYGGAFYPTQEARRQGFDQVLWTDGGSDPAIEESGMMNVLFVIDNKLVTAPLSDTILDGVTRDSLLTLAADRGVVVEQRRLRVSELEEALRRGVVQAAFGAGTAAVVAPIQTIQIGEKAYQLPAAKPDALMHQLKQQLDAIRLGETPDMHGWNTWI
ncbi:MAG: branched-chain amino acid aminotransferase [Chitinophagaceae bacterium]|nr:branched-chain amino acid aminotransferase [Chitinophagaceae bacterium]